MEIGTELEPPRQGRQPRYQRRYRYRRGSPYWKSVWRSFEGALSRWLAVFSIIGLGAGVFAGLQSVALDMYQSADRLYDQTNFMDLRVTSTAGLTGDDVQALRQVPGVRQAQPQIITEGTIVARDGVYDAAILSIDLDHAEPQDPDAVPINQPVLLEGRLPTRPDELLISRGLTPQQDTTQVGDVVTIGSLYGADQPGELLRHDEYTVVGVAESAYYLSGDVGQSPRTGAVLSHYAYLPLQAFNEPELFTDVFLTVHGALERTAFHDDHEAVVEPVAGNVKDIAGQREQARYNQIRDGARQTIIDGQQQLDDQAAQSRAQIGEAQAELDRSRAEAERQLAEAQRTIDENAAALTAAEAQLADGQAAFDSGLAELARQRQSVTDELAAQQRTIDDGWAAYQQGLVRLAESEQTLADGQAQLDAAQVALSEARTQLDQLQLALTALNTRDELLAQLIALGDQRAQILAGLVSAEATFAQLQPLRPALEAARDQAQAAVDQLAVAGAPDDDPGLRFATAALNKAAQALAEFDETSASVAEGISTATAGITAIDEAILQLDAGIAGIDQELAMNGVTPDQLPILQAQADAGESEYQAGLTIFDEQLAAFQAGVQQFEEASRQAIAAREQLVSGQQQLDAARSRAEAEFAAAEEQLANTAVQLQTGRRELADGRQQLADAQQALADQQAQVQARLADGQRQLDQANEVAEAEIRNAQQELDDARLALTDLDAPSWYVLDRDANPGYAVFKANAERVDTITSIFPYFFALVAGLVALTTMTRMVESERGEIGTLKALGHPQRRIISKYLLYSGSAAVIGGICGVLVGSKVFPTVIWNAYQVLYSNIELQTPLQPGPASWSILVAVLGTMAVTAWAAWATLTEGPSELMRPRAPVPGRRILLERVRPLWSRLSFSHKVTARNLFRYKKRMLMTLIGVAGCTGLLLTGFGLNDNLRDFVDEQYGEIFTYNTSILFDSSKDADAARASTSSGVAQAVLAEDSVSRAMFFSQQNVIAENPGGDPADIRFGVSGDAARTGGSAAAEMRAARADRRADDGASGIIRDATLMVPADAERIDQFIRLTDARTREPLRLADGQVVITPRLAENLLIGPGDTFQLSRELEDEPVTVSVGAVAHLYGGHYVFMSRQTYADLFGEAPRFSHVLAEVTGGGVARAELLQRSLKVNSDAVLSVVDVEYQAKAYSDLTSNLTSLVAVIVVSSGLLAFVVLYNLTNINIEERRREIATIKVLGFRDREVDAYVFRETGVLSILGGVLGLPLGWALCTWVARSAELDNVAFGRVIHWPSYAWAFGLTLVFTLVVMGFLRPRLRSIDMVSSLKSVE